MTRAVTQRGEFGRIAAYFAPLAASHPGAFGLRDDAAVIAPKSGYELVVTTDTIVAGVHYIGDEPPELIATKLLRVNLSDLAAMGARARFYTLNIALPRDTEDRWVEAFAAGLAAEQDIYGIVLVGGDSVATTGPAVFTLTAFGEAPIGRALRREGARVGDRVYVSGTIGDGALGLRVLQNRLNVADTTAREALVDRYRRPHPRLALGYRLLQLAHAAADVSDGLVADLGHIAKASGVAAVIKTSALPLSEGARSALAADSSLLQAILTGGDDYELVFCAAADSAEALKALADELDLRLTAIGHIEEGTGVRVLDGAGNEIEFVQSGFTHG